MTRIWTAGLLAAAIGAVACSNEEPAAEADSQPVVAIVPNVTTGIAPLEVDFGAVVQGGNPPLKLRWDLGESFAPREGESVTHVFDVDGEHVVELVVTDADGDEARNLVVINVVRDIQPTVTLHTEDRRGVAPHTAFFESEASGNGAVVHHWDFGDGSAREGTSIAEHVFETPGNYVVTLRVVDEDGDEASTTQNVVVEANSVPEVTVAATPLSGTAPLDVEFTCTATGGNGALRYDWQFGDGESSPLPSTLHTYVDQETYRATCTVTDQDGDVASAYVDIDTNDHAPTAVASVLSGACAIPESEEGSTRVELDGTASSDPEGMPLVYEWTFVEVPFGSSARLNNAAVAKPSFTPDLAGLYRLRLFVSDGNSRVGSDEIQVVVSGEPAAISVVGGGSQQREVNQPLQQALVVRVENACGLGLPGQTVAWTGFNGQTTAATSPTDRNGLASVGAKLGTLAGEAAFVATAGAAAGRVEATVLPGPGALVIMDVVAPTAASAITGATVTFQLADQHYNPTTGAATTFDVELVDPEGTLRASFDAAGSGTTRKSLTTSNGLATATVFSTVAHTAYVRVIPPDGLSAVARQQVLFEDFEGALDGWSLRGDAADWEAGAPVHPEGPAAAYEGIGVLGTRLAEPHSMSTFASPSVAALQLTIENPYTVLNAFLHFWQWIDTDVSAGCAAGAGHVTFDGNVMEPIGGHPGPLACDALRDGSPPLIPSFSGRTAGWVQTELPIAGRNGELAFEFRGSDDGKPRPGWYLDEVRVVAYAPAGPVVFTAAP